MRCFPLFIDLQDADVLIIGYSALTEEKISKLLPYRARIKLFAPDNADLPAMPEIEVIRRPFRPEDLQPAPALVLITGGSEAEKRGIYQLCREQRIPVNTADEPDLCTFYFPALITRGSCSVGISTSGVSPSAAALLRRQIEEALPDRIDEILDWSYDVRQQVRQTTASPQKRRLLMKLITAAAFEKNRPLSDLDLHDILSEAK